MIYTGKTRIAKSILYNVVDNWFLRKAGIVEIMEEIKDKADEMWQVFKKFATLTSSQCETDEKCFEDLGSLLSDVRRLNLRLEKSITNDYIEELYNFISPYVTGYNVIGAGSGGYIFGYLRKGCDRTQIADLLQKKYPNARMSDIKLCV